MDHGTTGVSFTILTDNTITLQNWKGRIIKRLGICT